MHLPKGDLDAITESDQEYESSVSKPPLRTAALLDTPLVRRKTVDAPLRKVFSADRAAEPDYKMSAAKSKFLEKIKSDSEDYESHGSSSNI